MSKVTNTQTFFAAVREDPFDGHMTQAQVNGLNTILDTWNTKYSAWDNRWLAYALATAFHETATTMQPIEEYGKGRAHSYGVADPVTKQTYYGRGLVQLTWKANYDKAGKLVGQDLVTNPAAALLPQLATKIMFEGMNFGMFTGKKFSDYFNATVNDPVQARRIINGVDRAHDIAAYYAAFRDALQTS